MAGLRVLALDTSVPDYHHGELTDDQLGWLAEHLATPAEHGTLLAMHHPPIPVPMLRAAEIIELLDQHRLADVIAGTDVRAILGGHFHYTSWSTFAGVPVSVASASCYTTDPAPLDRLISGVDGNQAMTMLHLYDDRVVHTVVPLPRHPRRAASPATSSRSSRRSASRSGARSSARKDSEFNQSDERLHDPTGARGHLGMVASTHWLASQSGMAVLEAGGNAFDAAVAAGFVLHVVEPHLNGPGGDLPASSRLERGRRSAARALRSGPGPGRRDDRALRRPGARPGARDRACWRRACPARSARGC